MSNTERQRRFRASHPGYFNKYKRRVPRGAAAREAARIVALAAAEASVAPAAPPMSEELPNFSA
jgi:hypothetical protein